MEKFLELFYRLRQIKGSYRIELQDDAKPFSIVTPRRVPDPLIPDVKKDLERMER